MSAIATFSSPATTITTGSSPMSAWPRLWPPRGILTSLSLRRTLCTATVRREGADPAPGAGACMAGIRTQEVNRQQITRSSADSTRVVGKWEGEIFGRTLPAQLPVLCVIQDLGRAIRRLEQNSAGSCTEPSIFSNDLSVEEPFDRRVRQNRIVLRNHL